MRRRAIRALVPVAVLLTGLSGVAAAQETPSFDDAARRAALSWAQDLFNKLHRSPHGRGAGYRLALRPIQRHRSPDLNDRYRWQLYDWMLDALERADPRYMVVDRARVSEIYRAMEEVGTEDLERRYRELLKKTQTRIDLVCEARPRRTSVILSCRATDIDLGNRLGGGSVGFELQWLPPLPLKAAAGWIAREIVPRMQVGGGVGKIRVIDERTGGASRLSARVAGDLKRAIARMLADRPGFKAIDGDPAPPAGYRLEGTIRAGSGGRLLLEVDLYRAVDDGLVYSAWEEIALSTVPKAVLAGAPSTDVSSGDRADPVPADAGATTSRKNGCGVDPGATVLASGMTLADWRFLATTRLEEGDFGRLLVEAKGHLRNHCAWAPAAEVLTLAAEGLAREVEAGITGDPRSALSRLSELMAAAGRRPALLRLKARAHGLLGEDKEEAEAHVAWLRAAPQAHVERGQVVLALRSARKRIALADEEASLGLEGASRRLVRLGLAAFGHEGSSGTGAFDDAFRVALRSWQDSRKQEPTGWLTRAQAEVLIAEGRAIESERVVFEKRVGRPYSAKARDEVTGWTDLHYAAAFDLPRTVSALVAAGLEVDTRLMDDDPRFGKGLKATLADAGRGNLFDNWLASGETPLMIAAYVGAQTVAKALVQRGASINATMPKGYTALHFAAEANALEVAKWLVGQGADINAKLKYGDTPLHVAAQQDALETARWLVEQGADINATDNSGGTSLHHAAKTNALQVAKWLVEQGADINVANNYGVTPLGFATDRNALEVAKWLVGQGADINEIEIGDSKRLPRAAVRKNQLNLVKFLVGRGVYKSVNKEAGAQMLRIAAKENELDLVMSLVKQGADINAKRGDTLLHYAAIGNALEVAKWLVQQGADINAKTEVGFPPLDWAMVGNALQVAKWLVQQGADIYIYTKGVDAWTMLHSAAWGNAPDAAKWLVEQGADINAKDKDGHTPLHAAAWGNALDAAKWLVEQGADINVKDKGGRTPLHSAVGSDRAEVAELLVRRGADINAKNKDGDTPLHSAVSGGRAEVAELLVRHGADINAKDREGNTPLDEARAYKGRTYAVRLLKSVGGRCAKSC